jgi:hypothetical protein
LKEHTVRKATDSNGNDTQNRKTGGKMVAGRTGDQAGRTVSERT